MMHFYRTQQSAQLLMMHVTCTKYAQLTNLHMKAVKKYMVLEAHIMELTVSVG